MAEAVSLIQTHAPGGLPIRWATVSAGDEGSATAGDGGSATAGDEGILSIRWHDGNRYRIAVFYVGENGILPNVKYKVDGKGNPVKVEEGK